MSERDSSSSGQPHEVSATAGVLEGGDGRVARLRRWVAVRPEGPVGLALTVGVGGGLGAIAFRYMTRG